MYRFTSTLLITLSLATATGHGSVRWTGTRLSDGTIRFQIQDLTSGVVKHRDLHSEGVRLDRHIMVALDIDADSGRQGLSMVWTDQDNIVKADRIDLLNVVEENFTVETAQFRINENGVKPARVDESMTDAIARFEIDPTGGVGELFNVLETDRQQVDPVFGLPGDVDADGRVMIIDLLAVIGAWDSSCIDGGDCPGDANSDGFVGVGDILLVLEHLGETQATSADTPARLIHFQLVGGSWTDDDNHIHPQIFNDTDGWNPLLDNNLAIIEDHAPSGWDLWLHNPGGYWYDHDYTWRAPQGESQPMVFEQMAFARDHRPGLLELDSIRDWMADRNGRMYGYVGLPRTFASQTDDWTEQPEHGSPELIAKWYGDLLQQGFRGVGHDASAHHPADSEWITGMLPELRSRGIEVFLESIPKRDKPHLLGQSVVAEHRLWLEFSEGHPEMFYSQAEIEAAGGRAIHLVSWPVNMAPGEEGYDPDFNLHQWQYHTAMTLLEEGHTVALSLSALARNGYDVAPLVAAAN